VDPCPTDAIFVNPETGAIVIDKELCIQCGACVEDCRYQVIHLDPEGFPLTCDLCGGSPKCVPVCYPGALTFEEVAVADREPLRPFAQVLIDKSRGKNVPAPDELKDKSVT
jgi:Fe-S-cluster-containing dehydrogenase component